MNPSEPVDAIVVALARYLRKSPLASDTLAGIRQWWLEPCDVLQVDLVAALDRMALAGVIESVRAADGQVRYRRAPLNAAVDAQLDRLLGGTG